MLEDVISLSVGTIEDKKINTRGLTKYKIAYRDSKGRQHAAWTDWTRDRRYVIGDSIPVRNLAVPSFGAINVLLEVDNHPQKHAAPYVVAGIGIGIAAFAAGFAFGKRKDT